MRVQLKFIGALRDYYPNAEAAASGRCDIECAAGTTVRAALESIGVPDEDLYFIMVGDSRIDSMQAGERVLEDGESVVLIPILKGG